MALVYPTTTLRIEGSLDFDFNVSNLFRSLGLGRAAYQLYHRPVAWARSLVAEGGPWERRHSEQGRAAMEATAHTLPLLSPPDDNNSPLVVHLLTGKRFWYQTAFCLWTFAHNTGRHLAPVIYDDGTLTNEHRQALGALFPSARFVAQADTLARLETHLPVTKFPCLRERWLHYPNLRKLTDPHLGSVGWKLVLDSDLLFFRPPSLLTNWLDAPTAPLHAIDVQRSYGYSNKLLASLARAPLADKLNVGLCGLRSEELDWEQIEHLCRTLIATERTNYYLEQALIALLLAGRACTIAPASDYVTMPLPPEAQACRAVMHHYVADSKRWYFQHNWRRVLPANP